MIQRWTDEAVGMATRAAGELLVALVIAFVLMRDALVPVTLLAWAVVYLGSCALFPLRNCGACDGQGKPRRGDGRGNWRDRVCRRCKGEKERRRWGALLLGRGAPDRHDEKV